jgi:predicted ATP-grasp superfamily ATP-dependent carboligase
MTDQKPGALPPVFVMNTYYTGIGIVRNLHRYGVDVYGLSSEPNAPGVRSRFFKRIYTVPNGRDEPDALCKKLLELRTFHRDAPVIFPTRDFDVLFLHNYRKELNGLYRLPQNSAVECLLDKLALFEIARTHGIVVPATVVCSSLEQIDAVVKRLRFPLVVKPRIAAQWRRKGAWQVVGARKAFLVENARQLHFEYAQIAAVSPEIMLQEYVQGSDCDIAVCCCFVDDNHEMQAFFTARKLLQNPPLFGTGCAVETVDIPEIVPIAQRLLAACGYSGLAEVEFKRDSFTGEWFLIEVNPRHWDQHEIGAHIGVNLSWVAYQKITGRTLPPQRKNRRSAQLRWIAETEALMLILRNAYVQFQQNRNSTNTIAERLSRYSRAARTMMADAAFLLKGRKVFAILNRRDPLPGIFLCFRTVRELGEIFTRRIFNTRHTHHATVD